MCSATPCEVISVTADNMHYKWVEWNDTDQVVADATVEVTDTMESVRCPVHIKPGDLCVVFSEGTTRYAYLVKPAKYTDASEARLSR